VLVLVDQIEGDRMGREDPGRIGVGEIDLDRVAPA
jgi:hypothetical protein